MKSKNLRLPANHLTMPIPTLLCSLVAIPILNFSNGVYAQPSPITPSGLNTDVLDSGTTHTIIGGTRHGTNLFHSFETFNVPRNHIANFQNDSGANTSNILARVTGDNPSLIFGTIKTTGFNDASLFLMNPAGIVFGPDATLNVGGSVTFTTADYLRLAAPDGAQAGIFHANPNNAPILTSAPVAAYGFLADNSAAIAIRGSQLNVQPDQSISLIAGNRGFSYIDPITGQTAVPGGITMIGGTLSASNGQINIGSIASPGELKSATLTPSSNIEGNSPNSYGNITLSENAVITTSGNTGGAIRIRGGRFSMDSAGLIAVSVDGTHTPTIGISVKTSKDISLSNQSALIANVQGEKLGSAIELSGRNISLAGGSRIRTVSDAGGKAGDIKLVAAESLSVTGADSLDNPTLIQSDTQGNGDSGAITVTAPLIKLADRGSIETRTFSGGRAGDITIEGADNIELRSGGSIGTYGTSGASSGNIHLSASDTISVSGQFAEFQESRIVNQNTIGETGSIFITTNHLELAQHGRINLDTFQTKSTTSKPTINIQADTSVTLSEGSGIALNSFLSDVGLLELRTDSLRLSDLAFINTQTKDAGASGPIQITVGDMQLSGGSQIRSDSPNGFGRGGNISITSTGSILLTGQAQDDLGSLKQSGIFSSTSASLPSPTAVGSAGHITLKAQSLTVTDNARIDSTSTGFAKGNAGDITIQTPNLLISNGIVSSASEFSGNAGSLFIQGTQSFAQLIHIGGANGGLFTETKGAGRGGQITTWSHELRLTNQATISSKTSGSGDAGNILIKANDVAVTDGATVTAESTGIGKAGTVTIKGLNSPANSFLLDGVGSNILTSTTKTGAGGNILIDSKDVRLRNGAKISAETSGTTTSATGGTIDIKGSHIRIEKGALVTASSTGAGKGGTIAINAAQAFENSGGIVQTTATQAQAGDITITAGRSATLTNGAITSTRSEGLGNAGSIFVRAGRQFNMKDSQITATANRASGGNIDIRAIDTIRLTDSRISSSVQGGPGTTGGNISIDPNLVVLQNSQVLAQAVRGNGGNITITTPLFLADQASLVDASSQFGLNGTVTIQSPISNLSGTVGQLTSKPSQAHVLVQNQCAALANGLQSSFIVAGRHTLPVEPGGWLGSSVLMAMDASMSPELAAEMPSVEQPLVSGSETLSLRRLTPAGFLVRSFGVNGSTGCRS